MNRKKAFFVFILALTFGIIGCKNVAEQEAVRGEAKEEQIFEELKQVAELYRKVYEQASVDGETRTVELKRQIVECLGSKGYVAIDNENLVNMVNAKEVEVFIERIRKAENGEVTFYQVMDNGGLVRYELESKAGELDVVRSSLIWDEGEMQRGVYEEFTVRRWDYTEKGWFFLEQCYPEGYDGPPGQVGIRVKALDESMRELNQKYVAPIGYGCNNLLITDWDEADYSALDFYDLFEIIYRMKFGTSFADNGGVEAIEYWIPVEEFENVFQAYINVPVEVLREKTVFDSDKLMYRYRPRTMDEMEMPYGPEPEVVACEEQKDGTLKLTVEAVWVREFSDCVILSELVVRPMEDGTFRYVSNRVKSIDDKLGVSWRKERLTDEEWELLWTE